MKIVALPILKFLWNLLSTIFYYLFLSIYRIFELVWNFKSERFYSTATSQDTYFSYSTLEDGYYYLYNNRFSFYWGLGWYLKISKYKDFTYPLSVINVDGSFYGGKLISFIDNNDDDGSRLHSKYVVGYVNQLGTLVLLNTRDHDNEMDAIDEVLAELGLGFVSKNRIDLPNY